MHKYLKKAFCFISVIVLLHSGLNAQVPINPLGQQYNYDRSSTPTRKDTTGETLKHRDKYEDSITISYHYWDSTRINKIDSSIDDFYTRFPVPWTNYDLGNFGSASKSFIFQPNMKPGFDAGFHAYDVYLYTPANTKFYQTTRPYSETVYLLGSRAEQMINLFHTQNKKSNFNFGLDFKILSSPGAFKNQSTVTSNGRINTFYQSNNKRYTNNFIFITNKILSSENGGLKPGQNLDSLAFNDPFGASTKLGDNLVTYRSIFNSTINTGTQYKELLLLMQHSYDFGQKDSLVTDSVTYKLFYPRIRLQHTIQYSRDDYEYHDFLPVDSDYYNYMHYSIAAGVDTVKFNDTWRNLTNDFAIISFPQKNNLGQFLKLNTGLELIKGTVSQFTKQYNNVYAAAEYRNRTRNRLYDIEATGKLYVTGHYAGDYSAYISLQRSLRKNLGSLKLGFQNVTRTPSFVTTEFVSDSLRPASGTGPVTGPINQALTSFPVTGISNYNKENSTKIFAMINISPADLQFGGEYYLISNYTFFNGLYTTDQYAPLFNVLHLYAQKKLRLAKHWNWYIDGHFQQTTGNPPVHVPLVLARTRFAFEGNFFKNLFLSTGFEARYNTPYKADSYSPLTGQFVSQNTTTISNLPDLSAYLNIRIKGFKGFLRVENLNSISFKNGFSFTNYNYPAPDYPGRGFWFRMGIWWSFVN
jgi:hypothetical protein